MPTRFREGKVTVDLSGDLERLALEAVDRILPGVRERLETDVKDVLATARGEWPVKSGRSQAGLQMVTEISDDAIRVKIENKVPYTLWVRPRAWFGTTTAWNRLVRGPVMSVARLLPKKLKRTLVDGLKKKGGG